MSAKVAVVICNWNKKEYLLKCIQSVLDSSYSDFDIIVVDNHSSDGSAEAVLNVYGSTCRVIRNNVNRGGAGGFNTGMREALIGDYEYIYLLDNDVVLDNEAMKELALYLDDNASVGAVGSKLFVMDHPQQIQEMGSDIDWDRFHVKPHYKGSVDHEGIPEVVFCDYVPACSVMVRVKVIREVGLMDEDCFIYWDDIEWFYRMKIKGFKIASLGSSKVWHKMGAANRTTTFPTYYFWRNRVYFFAKYVDLENLPGFVTMLSREMFNALFFSNYKKQWKTAQTILMAVRDAVNQVRGKARDNRIQEREDQQRILEEVIASQNKISIIDCPTIKVVRDIVDHFTQINKNIVISLIAKNHELSVLQGQFPQLQVLARIPGALKPGDLICQATEHVLDIRDSLSADVHLYVDHYLNMIYSERDIHAMRNYDQEFENFTLVYQPVLEIEIMELRKEIEDKLEGGGL